MVWKHYILYIFQSTIFCNIIEKWVVFTNSRLFDSNLLIIDLQLKPYRTDEYVHKLFYETSRFTAFNHQWVVKARINNAQRDPHTVNDRRLTYQVKKMHLYLCFKMYIIVFVLFAADIEDKNFHATLDSFFRFERAISWYENKYTNLQAWFQWPRKWKWIFSIAIAR